MSKNNNIVCILLLYVGRLLLDIKSLLHCCIG